MSTSTEPRPGVTVYAAPEGGPRFLSDVIIELGLADEEHVNRAVEEARQSGATVGQILVGEGRLSEDDLARALAARYGLNHIDLNQFEVNPDAANLLPAPAAQRYKAIPLAFEADGSLLVAMADPSDSLALNDISFMTHLEVQAAVAAANLISDLADRLPLPPSDSAGSPRRGGGRAREGSCV
jgi:type IV pilus assembly protein PilB